MMDKDVTWENEWGGKFYLSHDTSRSQGTAILINKNLALDIEKTICDEEGRVVCLKGIFNGKSIVLCNIYAPNEDIPSFFIKVVLND